MSLYPDIMAILNPDNPTVTIQLNEGPVAPPVIGSPNFNSAFIPYTPDALVVGLGFIYPSPPTDFFIQGISQYGYSQFVEGVPTTADPSNIDGLGVRDNVAYFYSHIVPLVAGNENVEISWNRYQYSDFDGGNQSMDAGLIVTSIFDFGTPISDVGFSLNGFITSPSSSVGSEEMIFSFTSTPSIWEPIGDEHRNYFFAGVLRLDGTSELMFAYQSGLNLVQGPVNIASVLRDDGYLGTFAISIDNRLGFSTLSMSYVKWKPSVYNSANMGAGDYTNYTAKVDDVYIQSLLDNPGAQGNTYVLKETLFGFLMTYYDGDGHANVVLIDPKWETYQTILFVGGSPTAQAAIDDFIAGNNQIHDYSRLMIDATGRFFYAYNTYDTPLYLNGIVYVPSSGGTIIEAVTGANLYKLPCFVPCIPHTIRLF